MNQEVKADAGKLDLTLVPTQVIKDIAKVREYGVEKYGSRDNWRKVGIERYNAALFRHLLAYLENPYGIDEESGIAHYKHIACNVAFICQLQHDNVLINAVDRVTKAFQNATGSISGDKDD